MSKTNYLVDKIYPNNIKFYKIKDITKITIGEFIHKNKQSDESKYPVYNGGISNTGFYDEYNNDGKKVIISARGANAGFVNRIEGKYWAGNSCYTIDVNDKNQVDWNYLYYYLKNNQKDILGAQQTGSIPSITKKQIEEFKIAIPPIEVQEEIVKILDKFSELEAELEAELEERKKQYDYYKRDLFENIKNVKIKHITDIAMVKARVGWQRLTRSEYLQDGEYCLITGTDFQSDGHIDFNTCVYVSKERYEMDKNIQIHKDDILITKDGTLGKVAIIDEEPEKSTTLNSGVFRIKIKNDNIIPRYIYHYFTSRYFKDFVESVKTGSTIPHLTQQGLITLNIPIPPIEEQERIVNILDKFDKLVNDTLEGLPAEIELRRKQYEYYRNKLLNFKEVIA